MGLAKAPDAHVPPAVAPPPPLQGPPLTPNALPHLRASGALLGRGLALLGHKLRQAGRRAGGRVERWAPRVQGARWKAELARATGVEHWAPPPPLPWWGRPSPPSPPRLRLRRRWPRQQRQQPPPPRWGTAGDHGVGGGSAGAAAAAAAAAGQRGRQDTSQPHPSAPRWVQCLPIKQRPPSNVADPPPPRRGPHPKPAAPAATRPTRGPPRRGPTCGGLP